MNIMLPKHYFIDKENGAYVTNNTLYIEGNSMRYRKIMYNLTYAMKFQGRCCYCSHHLYQTEATMDHLYPQCMGGITIPDNMDISCRKCNVEKGSLNLQQFKLSKRTEKVRSMIPEMQEKTKRKIGFDLPEEWISNINFSKIKIMKKSKSKNEDDAYNKVKKHYFMYKNLPRPIIVDKNFKLLDGIEIYLFAKSKKMRTIPVIILENVKVIF